MHLETITKQLNLPNVIVAGVLDCKDDHLHLVVSFDKAGPPTYSGCGAVQGSIKLCSLQTQVKSMFELTRLHRVFDIYQTVDEALESY